MLVKLSDPNVRAIHNETARPPGAIKRSPLMISFLNRGVIDE
jgi:hypothetical protein